MQPPTSSATPPRGWRQQAPALLAWLAIAVLPFGRVVEVVVLLMAAFGLVHAVRARRTLFDDPRMRLLWLLFAVYWLPIVASVPDSVDIGRSLPNAIEHLRFLFSGVFLVAFLDRAGLRLFLKLSALVLVIWIADALLQWIRGTDIFGYEPWPGRLSGMFGRNSKFGLTLAVYLPLLWEWLRTRHGWRVTLVVMALSGSFVLVAGSRAAWIVVAVTAFAYALGTWQRHRKVSWRLMLIAVLVVAAWGVAAYSFSERVSRGVDEALAGFLQQGDRLSSNSIYHRYWIWKGAVAMFLDHPVNGVGVRNFRVAFADYVSPDDPFFGGPNPQSPTHSHQLLLETASETGIIGLAGLFALWYLLFRAYRRSHRTSPGLLVAVAAGIAGGYFPINTHLAIYSSYWSQIMWFLIGLFCVCAYAGPQRETDGATAQASG